MSGDFRFGAVLVFLLALTGCQLGGAGGGGPDVASPGTIQGPAVEVTTLAPIGAEPAPAAEMPSVPAIAPDPEEEPEPAATKPKSSSQIACEKRRGRFVALGKTRLMTCEMPTRDGGKQCRRAGDCDGVCLARSGTCAPVKPLIGCNAVLQGDGRQVTLCIE